MPRVFWNIRPIFLLGLLLGFGGCLSKDDNAGNRGPSNDGPVDEFEVYTAEGSGGLRADYYTYSNDSPTKFQRKVLTKVDKQINYLQSNTSWHTGVPRDRFSAKWTGYIVPPKSGRYVICTCTDDGVRVVLDGKRIISRWQNQAPRFWWSESLNLEEGKEYRFKMEFYEATGSQAARLFWAYNPAGTSGENVCYSTVSGVDGDGIPFGPEQKYDCGNSSATTNIVINPELKVVGEGSLIPAGTEIDTATAACESSPSFSASQNIEESASFEGIQKARSLFKRLAGIELSSFDNRIIQVAKMIDDGKLAQAARFVTEDPNFLDKTVRSMAARISTFEERPDVPLNDFIATVAGITRDEIDARKLLTGGFAYRAKPVLSWYDESDADSERTLKSNLHYEEIEASGVSLKCALDKLDPFNLNDIPNHMRQMLSDPRTGSDLAINPDPAGLLTTRSFANAHIKAGTNRRPVQKAFEYFLCSPIDDWRDAELPDTYVGRDVERFPNGPQSHSEYQANCKSCHAPMDGMRGAFSKFHFENDILKHSSLYLENAFIRRVTDNAETVTTLKLTPQSQRDTPVEPTSDSTSASSKVPVVWKMNHNVNYSRGHFVEDDSFVNLLDSDIQLAKFGWSGDLSGQGVREFGRMIANSRAFPQCMTKRVYAEVCKHDPLKPGFPNELEDTLNDLGEQFARTGYNLRHLFEAVALSCLED